MTDLAIVVGDRFSDRFLKPFLWPKVDFILTQNFFPDKRWINHPNNYPYIPNNQSSCHNRIIRLGSLGTAPLALRHIVPFYLFPDLWFFQVSRKMWPTMQLSQHHACPGKSCIFKVLIGLICTIGPILLGAHLGVLSLEWVLSLSLSPGCDGSLPDAPGCNPRLGELHQFFETVFIFSPPRSGCQILRPVQECPLYSRRKKRVLWILDFPTILDDSDVVIWWDTSRKIVWFWKTIIPML